MDAPKELDIRSHMQLPLLFIPRTNGSHSRVNDGTIQMNEQPKKHSRRMKYVLRSLLALAVAYLTGCENIGVGEIFGPPQGPTIGAPTDGEHLEEIGRYTVTKPDALRCGFNDLSLPNPAVYNRIKYRVRVYSAGVETRTYTKEEDKFDHCVTF
jgi:hypothetical protein